MNKQLEQIQNLDIEINLIVDAIKEKYGYDFTNYSKNHIRRRIDRRVKMSDYSHYLDLLHHVLNDHDAFTTFLDDFSIAVTQMFRDPLFFKSVLEKVFPLVDKYKKIKIWHAGCATGQEVYSMAILLKEYGIYDKCQIYATDYNKKHILAAKEGIYPLNEIQLYSKNYIEAGGMNSLSDYYVSKYDSVIFDRSLSKNILFTKHNLCSDGVFNEMHVVICRNVMIYFNKTLQEQVIKLFYNSLIKGGVLGIGSKESLKYSKFERKFNVLDEMQRLYLKK